MRLTLRTLLAYLDDAPLTIEDRTEIQRELESQPAIGALVKRLQSLVAQPRMASPAVETAGRLQANQIAEYLDGTLDLAATQRLEQACLKNDSALSEVAALHQILTHWIDQPAEISDGLRDRLYNLAALPDNDPAEDHLTTALGAAAPNGATATAIAPDNPSNAIPADVTANTLDSRLAGRDAIQSAAQLLHLRELECPVGAEAVDVGEQVIRNNPERGSAYRVNVSGSQQPWRVETPAETQATEAETSQRGSWVLALLVLVGIGFLWWNQSAQRSILTPEWPQAAEKEDFNLMATGDPAEAEPVSRFQLPPLSATQEPPGSPWLARGSVPPILPASAPRRDESRGMNPSMGGDLPPPTLPPPTLPPPTLPPPTLPPPTLATAVPPSLPLVGQGVRDLPTEDFSPLQIQVSAGRLAEAGGDDIRVPELPPLDSLSGPLPGVTGLPSAVGELNAAAGLSDDLFPALAVDPATINPDDGAQISGETNGEPERRWEAEAMAASSGADPADVSPITSPLVAPPTISALPPVDEELGAAADAVATEPLATEPPAAASPATSLGLPTPPAASAAGLSPLTPRSPDLAGRELPAEAAPAIADPPVDRSATTGPPPIRHLEWGQQVGTIVIEEPKSGPIENDWVVVLPGGRSKLAVRSPQGRSWQFTFSGVSRYQLQSSQGQPTVSVQRCFLVLETDTVNESLEIVTPKGKLWVTALTPDAKVVLEIRPFLPHGSTAETTTPRYYLGCLGIAGRVMIEHQRREEILFANKWWVVKPDGEAEGFQAEIPLAIQNAISDLQNPTVPSEIQRLSDLVQSQAGVGDLRSLATTSVLRASQAEVDQRSLAALWSYSLGHFEAGFAILNDPAMRDYWDLHLQSIMVCLQSDSGAVSQLAAAAQRFGWTTSPAGRFVGLDPQTVKRTQVAELIADLEQPQLSRRVLALHTLKMLTNETFDYDPTASLDLNRRSLQRWKQWLEDSANARLSVHPGGSLIPSVRR